VKRTDLERWMRSHGAEPLSGRRGGGHDAWRNTETGATSFVPRHREIGVGVARKICKQLGIPPITAR
jgi:mRNA interferase HicA